MKEPISPLIVGVGIFYLIYSCIYPWSIPHYIDKFSNFFYEKSMREKKESIKTLHSLFFGLISFIIYKTTVLISQLISKLVCHSKLVLADFSRFLRGHY